MRRGDWFLTYTGRKFWPLDPQPDDVDIRDIAHHLSLICRFNGACRVHYSVAQHSLLVAELLPPELKFYGLLHDAPEAYIGDMVRPLKYSLPQYREVEGMVWEAVAAKYNLRLPDNYSHPVATELPDVFKNLTAEQHVKMADNIALMTERRDLLVKSPNLWSTTEPPAAKCIRLLTPLQAEIAFLETYDELKALAKS